MVTIQSFTFNPFEENTYLLSDETGEAVVIDPGCYERFEQDTLKEAITSNGLTPKLLLNTHGHIDHVLGNFFVKSTYKIPLLIHALDRAVLKAVSTYAGNYGFAQYHETTPDGELIEGDHITFGHTSLKILWLPGHAPGHVAFYHEKEKFIIGGDVLFYHSVGRTDLPGGNYETLMKSIREKLYTLPGDVTVYPGHGPSTTIGEEMVNNPFCALTHS